MSFAERFLRVLPAVEVAGWQVKRYHVNADDAEIEPAVVRAAHDLVPKLLPAGGEEAAFLVLHRGRGGAAFLSVFGWVWENVLEHHGLAAGVPEIGCPDEDPTHFVDFGKPWIGCVWELATLEHERGAWVRHMFQAEPPSLAAYLADTLAAGPIGNPA